MSKQFEIIRQFDERPVGTVITLGPGLAAVLAPKFIKPAPKLASLLTKPAPAKRLQTKGR